MFKNIEKFSEKIALINDDGKIFTYKTLLDTSDELFEKIKKRCLVFLLCENTPESIIGYVSFLRHNIVPLLLDSNISKEFLENLLKEYSPDYIYLPNKTLLKLGIEFECVWKSEEYQLIKLKNLLLENLHADLAVLITTSGSTGSKKLVRQSYKNLECNTKAILKYLNMSSIDRVITTLPMSYTYGLSVINSHLNCGASIITTKHSIISKNFWDAFKEYKPTTLSGVPYTYQILKKLCFLEKDLLSLKYLTQAGGRLSKELIEEFIQKTEEKGIKFFVMYGQTEATARISYLPPKKAKGRYNSIGIPIPGGSLKIVENDGTPISEANREGELVYSGDNVALGYATKKSDLSKGADWNNTLKTGDIAKKDKHGFYYITGRKKRFIKIFGNRINLDEVEEILSHKFNDCLCIGNDDSLIVATTGEEEDLAKMIKKHLQKSMKINLKSISVKKIKQIPKNESGKVMYSEILTDTI